MAEVDYDLVAVVFAHARPGTLWDALAQILVDLPKRGLRTSALIVTDRCTPAVAAVVKEWLDTGRPLAAMPAPLPLRSAQHGEKFNAAREAALRRLDYLGVKTRWVSFWDDDWTLLHPATAARALLLDLDVPYWNTAVLFQWDEDGRINVRQHHCSPLFFRYQPELHMHPVWHTHVPEELRGAASEILGTYLIDRGAVTPAERVALYRDCAKAGKCDPYTQRLVQPPQLKTVEEVLKIWPAPSDFVTWQRNNS